MPGFGSGPFGLDPLGQFNWVKRILYESAPEFYRMQDSDKLFEKYAEGQGDLFKDIREKIGNFEGIRDPRLSRTDYDETQILKLGRVVVPKGPIEQSGIRGSVDALRVFSVPRGKFSYSDIGKELTITGSSLAVNNRSVVISDIVDSLSVLTDPHLSVDSGPLRWEVRTVDTKKSKEIIVEILSGNVESLCPGWFVTDGFTTFDVLGRTRFKRSDKERKLLTLREGSDGSIGVTLIFSSSNLFLSSTDVGRQISISSAEHPENNGVFEITDVLTTSSCTIDNPDIVFEPTGLLRWALLRRPEVTLGGEAVLRGYIEQFGEDGAFTLLGPPATFRSNTAIFTSEDVGKYIFAHKIGGGSNGHYEISAFISSYEVSLVDAVVPDVGYRWELRAATGIGTGDDVKAYRSGILKNLAADYGVAVDNREDEETQRRFVESTPRWVGLKGTPESFEFLGDLTNFDVNVSQLWRVNLETYTSLPVASTFIVGESAVGRYGVDGGITFDGGRITFSSPTALFVNTDVGKQIYVAGSLLGNDGLYDIDTIVNSTTVRLGILSVATTPDPVGYPPGTLEWAVVRLYTINPPYRPVYDEINTDLMTSLVTAARFTADMYCWEANWSTTIGPGFGGGGFGDFRVISVSPATSSVFPITYTVEVDGDVDVVVGLGVGKWKLTDNLLEEYYLETTPVIKNSTSMSRCGVDGSLVAGPNFSSPTAWFVAGDVGKRINIISGAGSSHNERVYKIAGVIGPNTVSLTEAPPTLPDANNGFITWAVSSYTVDVRSTNPPAIGSATVEYICAKVISCGYCPSFRFLVNAVTGVLMEDPIGRLNKRLDEVTSKHAERVLNIGFSIGASMTLSAVVVTP